MAGGVTAILRRVRADFFRADRSREYRHALEDARRAGYRMVGLETYWGDWVRGGCSDPVLALWHQVDVRGVAGNWTFFEIERDCGARSSFYFRLGTFGPHAGLVRELVRTGFEVGYHHEEAATVAKEIGAQSRLEVEGHADTIGRRFRHNVEQLRRRHHAGLRSVAAHHGWIDSRLGLDGGEFITPDLLSECGLLFAADQPELSSDVFRVSDAAVPPRRWKNDASITAAIASGHPRIVLVTREKNWFPGAAANLAALVERGWGEARYRAARRRRSPGSLR